MRKNIKKTGALLLCSALVFSMLLTNSVKLKAENESAVLNYSSSNSYDAYYKTIADLPDAESEIIINSTNLLPDSTAKVSRETIYSQENCVLFENSGDRASFNFDVPKDGRYVLKFNYVALEHTTMDPRISIRIDGKVLWDDLEKAKLLRWWQNAEETWNVDSDGNEVTSEQVENTKFREQYIFDDTGVETEYYEFGLSKGIHNIEVISVQEPFAVKCLTFEPREHIEPYSNVSAQYSKYKAYSGEDIVIQGEDSNEKSSPSLTAKSDSLSATVQPQSARKNVINYIGSSNWSNAGQILRWNFNVDESALYELGFHFKQSDVVNGSVYRWLKIDGKTPFEETKNIDFSYDSKWNYMTVGSEDGKPFMFYLEKGSHTIELAVTLGPMAECFRKLNNIVEIIGNQYLKISMITGENPDPNRDYDLFSQIPDLESSFNTCISGLDELADEMQKMSQGNSSQYVTNIKGTTRILKQMIKTKYLAHTYKSDLYTQYSTISSLMYDMKTMPLSLDEVRFTAPGNDEPSYPGFLSGVRYTFLRFLNSFTKQYKSSSDSDTVTLKLWTTWGRDQTQVLNSLIAESFTPKYNINVNVQITGATVIQGMLTDNAPDIALGIPRENPVNFAMRGAIYNLSQFDDFDETIKQFNEGAAEPYYYNGNCYALPDTQSFYLMFYRKDILSSLSLKIPNTWDEFIQATSVIQRNNMNVYLPETSSATFFASLLMQKNLQVYNSERNKAILDEDVAIETFNQYTDFYTKYQIPVTSDFYNRLRIGITPLGIADYTTYTTLKEMAPDIEGRWGIALLPGTVAEDGTVNRACAGGGTGCVILNDCKNKDAAWTFLKWWTSADTQYKYSKNVESLLGATGRIATSNKKAFENYSWDINDLNILLQQWSYVREIPQVPGSYYLNRSVEQAYLSVINDNVTPSDALIHWTAIINDEIERMIKEYN